MALFIGSMQIGPHLAQSFIPASDRSLSTLNFWWLLGGVVAGYAFAWLGHFFVEKNRPATFTYPLYSFMGDWVMWKDMLTGKIRF